MLEVLRCRKIHDEVMFKQTPENSHPPESEAYAGGNLPLMNELMSTSNKCRNAKILPGRSSGLLIWPVKNPLPSGLFYGSMNVPEERPRNETHEYAITAIPSSSAVAITNKIKVTSTDSPFLIFIPFLASTSYDHGLTSISTAVMGCT